MSTRARGLPVVLCIDVEPDARLVDRANPVDWSGFERFVAKLPALRALLVEATGASPHLTWFLRMDDQIAETWGSHAWVADRYGSDLCALEAEGDELGLHVHTWRWVESVGSWLTEREDRGFITQCTTAALDAFEASFDRPCRSHHGGDRYVDADMMEIFAERGLTAELTIEPGGAPEGPLGTGELARGTTPDYRSAPFEPYRPHSPQRFLARGSASPVIIPMFSTPVGSGRAPLVMSIEPAAFASSLTGALATWEPPAMAFVVRSDLALLPQWDWFMTNLELVAETAKSSEGRFVTASEAAQLVDR